MYKEGHINRPSSDILKSFRLLDKTKPGKMSQSRNTDTRENPIMRTGTREE